MAKTTSTWTLMAVILFLAMALLPPPAAMADDKAEGGANGACGICEAKKTLREAAPWLELGGDLRLRLYYNNNPRLDKDDPSHEQLWQRHRARVWATITPVENLDFNIRLTAEPRYWCKPDSKESLTHFEALFDQFNVKWSKAAGLPLAITAGRQDMKFGEGWLIRDGTPADGGRTNFFDAVRMTLFVEDVQTSFDLIYIYNHANSSWFIRPFNDRGIDVAEHNEQGAILYVSNKSFRGQTLDGYFIYKYDDRVAANGWDSDLYTFGTRARGAIDENWKYRGEIALQFGHKNGTNVNAMGATCELAYHFNDAWKNNLRLGYEYRSGSSNENGAFDILWGRWCQFSTLYHTYLAQLETLSNAPSNFHRVGLGWGLKPVRKLSLGVDYNLLFRDRNTFAGAAGFSDSGAFRGQLVTAVAKYRFNEHLKTSITCELFFPGNYYDSSRNDIALAAIYQIIFSW